MWGFTKGSYSYSGKHVFGVFEFWKKVKNKLGLVSVFKLIAKGDFMETFLPVHLNTVQKSQLSP
jgi:hypothetical protein